MPRFLEAWKTCWELAAGPKRRERFTVNTIPLSPYETRSRSETKRKPKCILPVASAPALFLLVFSCNFSLEGSLTWKVLAPLYRVMSSLNWVNPWPPYLLVPLSRASQLLHTLMQKCQNPQFLRLRLAYFFPWMLLPCKCRGALWAEAGGYVIVLYWYFIAAAGIAPRWRDVCGAVTVVDPKFLHLWGIFLYVPQDLPSCCQVWAWHCRECEQGKPYCCQRKSRSIWLRRSWGKLFILKSCSLAFHGERNNLVCVSFFLSLGGFSTAL